MIEEIKEASARKHDGLDQTYYSLNLMLSPDDVVKQIKHVLMGEVCVNKKDEEYKQLYKPIMDNEGVMEISRVIEMSLGIPQVLGNLNKEEYNDLLYRIEDSVLDFIFFNAQRYNLSHSNYDILLSVIMVNITTFLSRTKEGFQQKHITRSWGGHEIIQQKQRVQDNEQKKN